MKKKILCFIFAVVVCVLISGCGQNDKGQKQVDDAVKDCIVVNTKYGVLYYPDQWTECVQINQSATDNALTVSFDAVINDRQYPLFDVVIGQDDGAEVGQLTDNSGATHTVYLHVDELQKDPSLTDGEQNRLYAMQEDVNYLIDNLK